MICCVFFRRRNHERIVATEDALGAESKYRLARQDAEVIDAVFPISQGFPREALQIEGLGFISYAYSVRV